MYLPRPMKATDQSEHFKLTGEIALPEGRENDYVVEPKVDGVRAFLTSERGKTAIFLGTSHRKVRHKLLQVEVAAHDYFNLVVDGELSIPGESLGTLVGALNAGPNRPGVTDVLRRVKFYVFDLICLGQDVSFEDQPLAVRRHALEQVVNAFKPTSFVELVPQFEPEPFIYKAIRDSGFEGFMLKDKQSTYEQRRSKHWHKVKWLSSVDCFVIGSQPGNGSNSELVGALTMGVYDEDGNVVEIGKHGVFNERLRREMSGPDGTLAPGWLGKVMEITYQSTGTNQRMRHPRLLRLRPDKTRQECTTDQFEEGKHRMEAR